MHKTIVLVEIDGALQDEFEETDEAYAEVASKE